MNQAFKKIFIAIILLGTFAVSFNILFGNNTVIYVQRSVIPNTTLTWFKFDTWAYINGLKTSIRDTTILQFNFPKWKWIAISGADWAADLGHDFAVLLNWIVMIINLLLYPLKLGAYILRFALAIFGLNFNDPTSSVYWMGQLVNGLGQAEIPYIGGIAEM